ncbi:Pkinase-domain-containing protein [Nemania sp. FL0031]|nr:Pkinase-domain-containing protein [Nemania sp. FL0031]
MDPDEDSQATQQATQNAFDPRRVGQQNSGFSDQDISDIICLLYPLSEPANREVEKIAAAPEYAHHIAGRYSADAIESDLYREDDAREFGRTRGIGDHALVLRLSSTLKDPKQGFTFGRNRDRCDICFTIDPGKRLSNIHFRIYVNNYGSVLLEDQSTNGTVVDNKLLRRGQDTNTTERTYKRRTLESGSTIKIVMHENKWDLLFLVRIPRREGEYEDAYMKNVAPYLLRLNGVDSVDDVNKTIGPGPTGHVHLFAPTRGTTLNNPAERTQNFQKPINRLPREWRGGDKYARVSVIGKGAFATVHKVTAKYDGSPYAAKELDKRKFLKNGVLDQKVENEMKIMQKVNHANIVKYIEHFDWDEHQFIIIMEYVPGGDLGKLILDHGPITEPHVKTIATQLVDALGYLHDNKITHRDVKPDNILIHSTDPLVVKLTDFGLSKMKDTEQTFLKTFCGTLLYCAPEVYTEYSSYDDYGQRTNRRSHRPVDSERYGHAVDIWSLGGVLFYTLTGSPPFPVKNGTTYTQLLDHIIKTPLNISPLVRFEVSDYGIHFLSRMIHVRPETRGTIAELQSHAWLNPDQDFDENLRYSASQLSLDDRQPTQSMSTDSDSPREPEPDFSMDFESQKENDTFGQPQVPKLFGEVSAIGSSGVIPEERLNLPVSDTSFGETEHHGSEIRDSFEDSDNFSTPRENFRQNQNNLSAIHDSSQHDNSRSALFGIGSQSLGGASSILKNLNMKSPPTTNLSLTSSRVSNLATSKRKPDDSVSDEYDTPSINAAPSLKRLKSEGNVNMLGDEDALIAAIPPLVNSKTGRQIDLPYLKSAYWIAEDDNTWHLNYPEMTSLQHEAFERAAEKRNEVFEPGKTPLWSIAMKYFPPTPRGNAVRAVTLQPNELNDENLQDLPSTTLVETLDNQFSSQLDISASNEGSSSAVLSTSVTAHAKIDPGVFKSTSDSLVSNILIPLQDPILSWGREASNTVIYQPAAEARVPKNAFRVLLWKERFLTSKGDNELRPWEMTQLDSSKTMRTSPEQSPQDQDSYAFYIATKATNGIRINGVLLRSYEPKDATGKCKYWMKLYNGDRIVFWGTKEAPQAALVFECSWGGSSKTRPADEPPTYVSNHLGQRLDSVWPAAVKALRGSRIHEEAQMDQEIRMQSMLREHELSRRFEQRRLEAVRRVAQQKVLPTRSAPVRARTGPPAHQFGLPGRVRGSS